MAQIIGLIYGHNENWIAGSYYIQNLVHALKKVSSDRPLLKIFSETEAEFLKLKTATQYDKMQWVPLQDRNTLVDKVINKVSVTIANRHLITRGIDTNVDILFPASDTFYFDNIRTKLFWIPDFQERHYPKFFSEQEIKRRKVFQEWIVDEKHPVVFSSNHSQQDFRELYPNATNKTFVMPFAVTLPSIDHVSIDSLMLKFGIDSPFFICSNQFWAHKNHLTVLKALQELKEQGRNFAVLFTGKPYDNRNPDYYTSLEAYVREHNLQPHVKFLGFIDRVDQLVLMKYSEAIIQPSLFEGWSTVVEDAKVLGVPVIVSDIPVHREQLPAYPLFFPPEDVHVLGSLMEKVKDGLKPKPSSDYNLNITDFGESFIKIVSGLQ